jgi:hypothetical protein
VVAPRPLKAKAKAATKPTAPALDDVDLGE